MFAEKNGLSFLETSALDSTNVETAFQTILTGECTLKNCALDSWRVLNFYFCNEECVIKEINTRQSWGSYCVFV